MFAQNLPRPCAPESMVDIGKHLDAVLVSSVDIGSQGGFAAVKMPLTANPAISVPSITSAMIHQVAAW